MISTPKLRPADADVVHEFTNGKLAMSREKPADPASTMPFPSRMKEKDRVALALYAAAAVAILAMMLSLLNLWRLHGPM
jgi:hypothetical protein